MNTTTTFLLTSPQRRSLTFSAMLSTIRRSILPVRLPLQESGYSPTSLMNMLFTWSCSLVHARERLASTMHTWSRPYWMLPQRWTYKRIPPTTQSASHQTVKQNMVMHLSFWWWYPHYPQACCSLIYLQLLPLRFMNHLVGPDDITANKDFKHIFKHQRNLLMCNKGILIQGFCITSTILHLQLKSHRIPSHWLRSLLNPNDKQDIVLAYSFLKEVWSLPLPPAGSSPVFTQAWEVLFMYGTFTWHLVMPSYVCIDLDLDQQLVHLSTAAHMASL